MKVRLALLVSLLALSSTVALTAAEPAAAPATAAATEAAAQPKEEKSVTEHTIRIGGAPFKYSATAGTLLLRNEKEEPTASVGYVAYTKSDVADLSHRPITFAYNGGPGSSSIWLHMGVLGPRRVVTTDAGPTPPAPYQLVDNEQSILDKTDLVMIDPVGTGVSRPVGKGEGKDFWGVDQDIASIGQFILRYVNANRRWNSPKFLLGESYGTMRSAGVVEYLQSEQNMAFNGVILVSVFVDAKTAITVPGNDLAYELFLPTYSAIAWYHKALEKPPASLAALVDEARHFAAGEYRAALGKGDRLPDAERQAVIAKMSRLTGLSADYLDKANLRVSEGQFTQELLRGRHETVGRIDSRFTGVTFDLLGEEAAYDPQETAVSAAFTAGFLGYYHDELKFGLEKTYNVGAELWRQWDWKHKPPGARFPLPGWPNTGLDLARAMTLNPNLRVLVLNGYYDLATPFFGTEYTMDHLGLDPKLRDHVEMKYYESGHMMYLHPASLEQFKADVAAFIDRNHRG